jgi:hypothetical protein
MVIMIKRGKRTAVRVWEVFSKIGKLGGNGYGPAAPSLMKVPNRDLPVGQVFTHRGFQHAKPQRLKPDVGVIKVLHRRLEEQ